MKTDEGSHAPAITVRAHAPERLVRSLARGHIACGCCCCCCCCLHTIGSIAGAIVGSHYPPSAPSEKAALAAKLRDDELDGIVYAAPVRPTVKPRYWLWTLVVAALVTVITVAIQGQSGFPIALGILVMAFPFVQLGASLLCALEIAIRPDLQRAGVWERLGWITLGEVIGGLLGFFVMYLPLVAGRR
jgi:hypothetical protein